MEEPGGRRGRAADAGVGRGTQRRLPALPPRELRRFKPYTLDERSEQIINTKNANGINAVMTLYSMLTNRQEYELEIDGEPQTFTEGEMRSSSSRPIPRCASPPTRSCTRLRDDAQILAQIYANRVRDWHTEYVELRGMPSRASRCATCATTSRRARSRPCSTWSRRNAPMFQEYFKLKGKWLGIEPLRRYDLYAPLATSTRCPFDEAVRTRARSRFAASTSASPSLAERVFADEPHRLARSARASAAAPSAPPSCRADALGDGQLHRTGARRGDPGPRAGPRRAQHAGGAPFRTSPSIPPLPLAETASVFSRC